VLVKFSEVHSMLHWASAGSSAASARSPHPPLHSRIRSNIQPERRTKWPENHRTIGRPLGQEIAHCLRWKEFARMTCASISTAGWRESAAGSLRRNPEAFSSSNDNPQEPVIHLRVIAARSCIHTIRESSVHDQDPAILLTEIHSNHPQCH
jgi:hypothetical protein